ncbi:hypothetical protein V6N13_098206 [Hibiscus sabdariffa]
MAPLKKPMIVRRVFADELERELMLIQSVIFKYPWASMDTEFPGTIFKANKEIIRLNNPAINYQYLKSNVDNLNIIQLGLTLSDHEGNLPDFNTPFCYNWEFNFKDFDIDGDLHDAESIEFLRRQGIDFMKNKEKGIDSRHFALMFWHSGLINYFRGLTWITFHSCYDFGFLLKILTQQPLPGDVNSFMEQLVYHFGDRIFDIKHTFKCLGLMGGLEKVAKQLNVVRAIGSSHQAGSDSSLTLECFMKLKTSKVFQCNQSRQMLPALALYGLQF